MPRLFIANFDFEDRLANAETLPRHIDRISSALAPAWTAIAEEGDGVWTSLPIDTAIFDTLAARGLPRLVPIDWPDAASRDTSLVFWGENEWAQAWAERWRFPWTGCDPAVVRRVNSRRFKFDLERRFGIDLPAASLLRTRDDVAASGSRFHTTDWVLKGEFGGAGREVRFGRGPLSKADESWIANRFRRGLAVTIEPRLDRVDEAGVQFQIDRDGTATFVGVTPLLTHADGRYAGSRFDDDPTLRTVWADAIEHGYHVAQSVAREGYFGPLGIDAMRYRDAAGTIRMRPLQDLNARYTMGRLALGLRRFPQFATVAKHTFRIDEFRATIVEQRA